MFPDLEKLYECVFASNFICRLHVVDINFVIFKINDSSTPDERIIILGLWVKNNRISSLKGTSKRTGG